MANFYLTVNALEKLIARDDFYYILTTKNNQIFLDIERQELDHILTDVAENNLIGQLALAGDLSLKDSKQEIQSMLANHDLMLSKPFSIFILNIRPNDAKTIRDETGLICLDEKDNDFSHLFYKRTIQCKEGESNHNWYDFLSTAKQTPSNCILINDRYFFNKDEIGNTIGIDNLYAILDSILPEQFKDDRYHVFIAYSVDSDIRNKLDFKTIATRLMKKIRKIRNYRIIVELLGYNRNTFGYEHTHNRLIATNYGYLDVNQQFSAFKTDNSSCVDQTIIYKAIFSEGVSDDSDFPEISQQLLVERIKEMTDYAKTNTNAGYEYALNGTSNPQMVQITNIKNRFLAN